MWSALQSTLVVSCIIAVKHKALVLTNCDSLAGVHSVDGASNVVICETCVDARVINREVGQLESGAVTKTCVILVIMTVHPVVTGLWVGLCPTRQAQHWGSPLDVRLLRGSEGQLFDKGGNCNIKDVILGRNPHKWLFYVNDLTTR